MALVDSSLGLAVAVLSTALPYSLEMIALTRLPTRTFGTLMSMEPALAAVSGMIFLAKRLRAYKSWPCAPSLPPQWVLP
ncbi:Threonine/homoserine exporter RhtA [Salmonella enterica subsp. enterica]|nr:Threonine/homoserine exporter RhtA [Salmonella enterica subsp. enterica]